MVLPAEIHHQQTIVIVFSKISEDKTFSVQHRAVDPTRDLFAKTRIFSPQPDKVEVERIQLAIFFAFGEIEVTTGNQFGIEWVGQPLLGFLVGDGRKLRQERETTFPNCVLQIFVPDVGEIDKRTRRSELLALKKHRCPWAEQE